MSAKINKKVENTKTFSYFLDVGYWSFLKRGMYFFSLSVIY